MRDVHTNAGMLYGDGANLPFSVQIDQSVFVKIPGLGHFGFPKFDIKRVSISEVFDFYGSIPRSKLAGLHMLSQDPVYEFSERAFVWRHRFSFVKL